MGFTKLIKNTLAYKLLDKDILSGNLSHAYMLCSSDQLFLDKLQEAVLCRIFCRSENRPCFNCTDCKRIINKNHPDAVIYPKNQKKINAEQISALVDQLYLKPLERNFKIFVLNNAEEINAQAQNKLLKTLEEPPADSHIFLFCKNKFNMLSTILSRVKLLETMPFSSQEIFDAIKEDGKDLNLLKIAAANSFGSLQRAMELAESENFKGILDFCYSLVLRLKSAGDLPVFSSSFNIYKDNFPDIINILQLIFRDILLLKSGLNNLITQSTKAEELIKIGEILGETELIQLIEILNKCNYKLNFNCNSQAVFDILCLDIIKAKQKA